MDPVNGADTADEYVSRPRNSPAAAGLPPSSMMRYGAVGRSWNTDTNTVKLYAHMMKNRGVNSGSRMGHEYMRAVLVLGASCWVR